MVPAIVIAEKHRRMKGVFVGAVAALAASQAMLFAGAGNLYVLVAALTLFFSASNVMEASLPSLITKTAPPDAKGTAMGLYSSLQFLGIFAGGAIGGWADQNGGSAAVFALTAAMALAWLVAAATMKQPSYLTTRLVAIGEGSEADALAARLREVPGVAEAVVVVEERLAYLKVDAKSFDAKLAESLAGAR
jgi:MFS family permease